MNEVLAAGQPCTETDTGQQKNGNGVDRWNDLPYVGSVFADVPPSGTGFRHLTAGVEDAAAKLIDDADFASANIDGITTRPSLRTLGSGAQQAAAGNHTHAASSSLYATGSFSLPTESYVVISRHLKLSGAERVTLAGTATLRMT